jgi:hypothetical protein
MPLENEGLVVTISTPSGSSIWRSMGMSVGQFVFLKINIFGLKINNFLYFELFWCGDFKKIKKNIILIYFSMKNTLKNNHTSKQASVLLECHDLNYERYNLTGQALSFLSKYYQFEFHKSQNYQKLT